ncbi:MAG: phosphatidate cytidylyltransferase [Nitrospiria bacterium]
MNIKQSRLAIAVILLPILYSLLRFLPPLFFSLFLSATILRVQYEFYRLFFQDRARGVTNFGLGLGFLLSICFFLKASFPGGALIPLSMIVFAGLMSVMLYTLFSFREIKSALVDSSVLFLGVMYISGFLSHLIFIRHIPDGKFLIIFLLIVIWGGDAGAYYIGKAIGKRKLYPSVSPNKTVEGSFGGLLGSFMGGSLAKLTFLSIFSWGELLLISLLLGGFGQLGDLAESLLKRSAGVKDSSSLVAAHGGLFDKLDSIAFAAPVFYYYLFWVKGVGQVIGLS